VKRPDAEDPRRDQSRYDFEFVPPGLEGSLQRFARLPNRDSTLAASVEVRANAGETVTLDLPALTVDQVGKLSSGNANSSNQGGR
jgi:hypothetical protein